jgi:hypothetical protein
LMVEITDLTKNRMLRFFEKVPRETKNE